jgi:hypothetical protein
VSNAPLPDFSISALSRNAPEIAVVFRRSAFSVAANRRSYHCAGREPREIAAGCNRLEQC